MKQVVFIYRVMPLITLIFLILFMTQVGFSSRISAAWIFFAIFSLSFAKRLFPGGRAIGRYAVIISLCLTITTGFFSLKIWQLIINDKVQNHMLFPALEGLILLMVMAIAYAFSTIKLIRHSRS